MNTLNNTQVKETLSELHKQAFAQNKPGAVKKDAVERFMAVSPEEGSFLYFLASLTKAKNIVEFGCSFGISTIYLASAAKDNGGKVISSEMEPSKIAIAKKNLEQAGVADVVNILQGDATQTLAAVNQPVDFLFLDGAKQLYLPLFEILQPKLHTGSVIFADNTDKPETHPFVDYILQSPTKFTTTYLFDGRALVAYIN